MKIAAWVQLLSPITISWSPPCFKLFQNARAEVQSTLLLFKQEGRELNSVQTHRMSKM